MSPDIKIGFTPEAEAMLARYQEMPQRVLTGVARAIDRQNQLTVGLVQRKYLSFPKNGPSVPNGLRVQSNRLRGSVRATQCVLLTDGRITSSIGSNVVYAAIHEFGGPSHHPARPCKVRLRTDRRGNLLRQGANGKLAVFARAEHKQVKLVAGQTKAYDVTLPERAFIRNGIADCVNDYCAGMSRAVLQEAKPQ
jgi:phage gpG-like protein